MSFLNGITALLIFQLIGEVGVHTLSLPIPGPVLGMFLLFVPAGIGVIVHFDTLRGQ